MRNLFFSFRDPKNEEEKTFMADLFKSPKRHSLVVRPYRGT